mgnify:CR=1 FL=1
MKKLICLILATSMFSNIALADCKWAEVKKVEGGFLYPDGCHDRVGKIVKDNDDYKIETEALRKTIDLKDLTIQKADERTELWRNTTFKVEDRLNNLESAAKTNQWVYFGLGVLSVFAAGYAAKQIYGGNR